MAAWLGRRRWWSFLLTLFAVLLMVNVLSDVLFGSVFAASRIRLGSDLAQSFEWAAGLTFGRWLILRLAAGSED